MDSSSSLSQTTGRDRWWSAGTALAGAAALGPSIAIFAPLGLAPLFGIVAVAILATDARRCWHGLRTLPALAGLLAGLAAWAIASTLWSVTPTHSLLEGLRLLAIEVAGLVVLAAATRLPPEEGKRLGGALVGGGVLALIFLLIERTSDGALTRLVIDPGLGIKVPIQRFDRGATTLVLALWLALPVLIARGQKVAAASLTVLTALLVLSMDSHAAILAMVAGLIAFGVGRLLPRVLAVVLALGLVASTVAMPLIMPSFDETAALYHGVRAPPPSTLHRLYARALNPSTIHRLFIWRFAGDRIAERPLWGWGMDAARDIPGGQLDLSTAYPQAVLPANARALPLHPHNATVEWRLDLGIPGAVLMLAILVWGLYRLGWHGALSANRRAGSLAWATSAIIIGCVSYGFWQAWWLACLWLGAALLAAPGTAAPVRDGR